MIKIKLLKSQKREIEELHWEWFEKRAKNKFRNLTGVTYKDFITAELNISRDDVKKIVTGKRSELDSFKNRIGIIDKDDSRYKKLLTAFGYDNFCNTTSIEWNAYVFCQKIGIDVCPYCNRQYIFTVKNSGSNITRPEIDHFYLKSKYPYLSCSLYNFIPSCHICNHIKRDASADIIYPYEEEFGNDGKFKIHFSSGACCNEKSMLDFENIEIDIKCSGAKQEKIKNSVSIFHLKELYNKHKLDLTDLLFRYRNYSKPKINDILRMFVLNNVVAQNRISLNEKNTIEDIIKIYVKTMKKMILGLPLGVNDKQYPLRKCKEDIIEQLDSE